MTQPQGFIDFEHPSYVCKFTKALYETLKSIIVTEVFKKSVTDSNLFFVSTEEV